MNIDVSKYLDDERDDSSKFEKFKKKKSSNNKHYDRKRDRDFKRQQKYKSNGFL